jgi:hypothetical protein
MPPVFSGIRKIPRFLRCSGLALLGMLLLGSPARATTAGRAETLEASHRIENPRDSTRPGRYGELGAYQFRRGTWRMHTNVPFERALDRVQSEEVAIRHYEWLKRGLARNGLPQTPYYIALAWNGGLASVVRGRSPRAAHDYAQRVTNMLADLSSSRLAAAP